MDNHERERALLGACLLYCKLGEVESLEPDDFEHPPHRAVFGAMLALARDGKPLDIVALGAALEAAGVELGDEGLTRAELSAWSNNVSLARSSLAYHVEAVRQESRRRQARGILEDAGKNIQQADAGDLDAILGKASDALDQAASGNLDQVKPRTDWSGEPPERVWLIPGWLPAHRVVLLTGEGGRGKSRLALQLAAAVARASREWLPGGPDLHQAKPAPSVLATWEDEPEEVARRLRGMLQTPGRVEDLGDRLHHVGLAGRGPLWEPAGGGSRHTSTLGELSGVGRWLRRYCERSGARLLVVDPLAAAYACNENDRGLVRQFMASWDGWAREARCTVLLLAHPSKADPAYSGSTDWQAAARAVWTLGLDKDVKDRTLLKCLKTSYGMTADLLHLTGYPGWRVEKSENLESPYA